MNPILIAVVALFVGWFAVGTGANVKRGGEALRWLRGGLKALGERTTLRWLGSTAVVLQIAEAREPFRSAEVVLFLEARDLPWMWALGRLRGRRDTLILRGVLRRPPTLEVEALLPGSWSERDVRGGLRLRGLGVQGAEEGGLQLHAGGEAAAALGQELLRQARAAGLPVQRLSVRPGEPHLQLHLPLPAGDAPAERWLSAFSALAAHAAPPP